MSLECLNTLSPKNSREDKICLSGQTFVLVFFIKKRLQHGCLPVSIEKFLRTALFIEHLWWLFLYEIE